MTQKMVWSASRLAMGLYIPALALYMLSETFGFGMAQIFDAVAAFIVRLY